MGRKSIWLDYFIVIVIMLYKHFIPKVKGQYGSKELISIYINYLKDSSL